MGSKKILDFMGRKFLEWEEMLSLFFLQEIMDVEHLWFSTQTGGAGATDLTSPAAHEAAAGEAVGEDDPMVQTLANMADKRLYKLVKWCKSLPLFKNIVVSHVITSLNPT